MDFLQVCDCAEAASRSKICITFKHTGILEYLRIDNIQLEIWLKSQKFFIYIQHTFLYYIGMNLGLFEIEKVKR